MISPSCGVILEQANVQKADDKCPARGNLAQAATYGTHISLGWGKSVLQQ
jgi:hypothetical protein